MNFSKVIAHHAQRRGSHKAVVAPQGTLTYAQLEERVRRIARGLAREGIGPGDRVALLLANGLPFLEAYLATLRVGAWTVPLNWRSAPDEIAYALDHSGSRLVITEDLFAEAVENAPPVRVVTTGEPHGKDWLSYTALAQADGGSGAATQTMDDVQRIMYTSGTTDRPKGALLTNGQVWWGCAARVHDFGLSPEDVGLVVAPLYHVGGLDSYTTTMLYVGGTVCVLPKFDPEAVLQTVEREGVTNCWLAPTMISMILEWPGSRRFDVGSLRVLLTGGERAPLPLLHAIHERWPDACLFNAYGLTECQGIATFLDPAHAIERIGSVGKAAWMREVAVLDSEGVPVAAGEDGEVVVAGPMVFPGYYRNEAATAGAFRGGWLHTGDVGRVDDDGYLFIVDRVKDMILSGGENIASPEVERVLQELPEVLQVAVVAMPHARWGEVPVAFVVARGDGEFDVDAALAHCGRRLARFKVPRLIHVVDELPCTPTGKVLKRELRERLAAEVRE